ncbi:MAG TPA: hypothetical protein VE291_05135 [Terracidiphilus sp.]|jgi:hypothetical protein|nr:hypothetical protein [Terracidiphilus sp.]
MAWTLLAACVGHAQSRWEQPASALAARIAATMGPGQAQMTVRNLSSINNDELPAIRKALEQDLKAKGITISGAESANALRVTLSETARERLWVAEIVEGSETQVAMVRTELDAVRAAPAAGGVLLRSETILSLREPVLSAAETANGWIVLETEQIVVEQRTTTGWQQVQRVAIGQRRPLPRDPRGVVTADDAHFDARVAGIECAGSFLDGWTVACHESDDPWPILGPLLGPIISPLVAQSGTTALGAFYNSARNWFTGVVTPSVSIDLPAFYAAALLPRAAGGAALVVGGVDGRVQMAENGVLRAVSGTRDWGSDFAVIESGCGAGTQVIASSSGAAASDSLRAYELPALEAVPASAPLAANGTVTALWGAPDGKSVLAVTRSTSGTYEVSRVTAFCN